MTPDAQIYYTIDNSEPSTLSPVYSKPVVVTGNAGSNINFKAITYKDGIKSATTSATFTFTTKRTDLVGYWNFNEYGNSNIAADSSVYNNDGFLSGMNSSAHVAGRWGHALQFNDSDDVLTIQSIPALELGVDNADYTIMFWLRLDQNASPVWTTIMQKGKDTGSVWQRTPSFFIEPNTTKLHYSVAAKNSPQYGANHSSDTSLKKDEWTHIACVKQANINRLYINGKFDSDIALPGNVISNSAHVTFGKTNKSFGFLKFSVDDLRIYSSALSVLEINYIAFTDPDQQYVGADPRRNRQVMPIVTGIKRKHSGYLITVGQKGPHRIEIINCLGRTIKSISGSGTQKYLIANKNYCAGVYIVKITAKNIFYDQIVLQ